MIIQLVILLAFSLISAEKQKDIALVVSGVPLHNEITMWIACTLKSMNIPVHSFLNIGIGPVEGFESHNDYKFHQMCSDKIVVLPKSLQVNGSHSSGMYANTLDDYHNFKMNVTQSKPAIKLMVLVSFRNDIKLLTRLNLYDRLRHEYAQHVLMIVHDAHNIEHGSSLCKVEDRCTIAHLADHVNDFAIALLNTVNHRHPVQTIALYPVIKHPQVDVNDAFYADEYRDQALGPSKRTAVIQGSALRRNFTSVFKCMEKLHSEEKLQFDLKLVGSGVELLMGEFDSSLDHSVTLHGGLSNLEYYKEIADSSFLVTFLQNGLGHMYNESTSSSSVSVGLIAGLPIVMNVNLLNKYKCLSSARVHQLVARKTDCESLAAAVNLTVAEYHEFRREAILCRDYLYYQTKSRLSGIMQDTTYSL